MKGWDIAGIACWAVGYIAFLIYLTHAAGRKDPWD